MANVAPTTIRGIGLDAVETVAVDAVAMEGVVASWGPLESGFIGRPVVPVSMTPAVRM